MFSVETLTDSHVIARSHTETWRPLSCYSPRRTSYKIVAPHHRPSQDATPAWPVRVCVCACVCAHSVPCGVTAGPCLHRRGADTGSWVTGALCDTLPPCPPAAITSSMLCERSHTGATPHDPCSLATALDTRAGPSSLLHLTQVTEGPFLQVRPLPLSPHQAHGPSEPHGCPSCVRSGCLV